MISKEMAEQVVLRERSASFREVRITSLESCKWTEEQPVHEAIEVGGMEMLQEEGWSCSFEFRDRHPQTEEWSQWYGGHCYVVEVKPGPYVIK